jgi:hypothetical protein
MNCPKCGYESLNKFDEHGTTYCRSCGIWWTEWQQYEIEKLSKESSVLRSNLLAMMKIFEHLCKKDKCIEWPGCRNRKGYGEFRHNGRSYAVHKFIARLFHGEGYALHKCDNPPCFNLNHLYAGTASQNAIDREARTRMCRCRAGGRKLSAESVVEIRSMKASGSKTRDLARMFNVKKGAIESVINGRTWKALNGQGHNPHCWKYKAELDVSSSSLEGAKP